MVPLHTVKTTQSDSWPIPNGCFLLLDSLYTETCAPGEWGHHLFTCFSLSPPDLATAAQRESICPHAPILQTEELRSWRKVAQEGLAEELGAELKYPGSMPGGLPGQLDDFLLCVPNCVLSTGLLILVNGTNIPPGAQAIPPGATLDTFLSKHYSSSPPHSTDQEAPVQC